jgi:hypothetical protein
MNSAQTCPRCGALVPPSTRWCGGCSLMAATRVGTRGSMGRFRVAGLLLVALLVAALALAGAGWATLALVRPPLPGTFSPTGSMSAQREGHTATLLLDGRVLIAGGGYGCCDDFTDLSSAELYDPATGAFSPTGSMTETQSTATLLKDGRMLIVGGDSTAAQYDPKAGKFTAAGSLVESMDFVRTATLLHDGRVLVTGYDESQDRSSNEWQYTPLAELYDPSTSSFRVTGAQIDDCLSDLATPLDDGRVLFVGCGDGDGRDSAEAELYDPATGSFSLTGAMTRPTTDPTATLLADGRVLVCGGYVSDSSGLQPSVASAEIYDPATGIFRATGNMTEPRGGATATLLKSGLVLIAGGDGDTADNQDSAELFNPATGTFSGTLWGMVTGRRGGTATLLRDGRVLIAGGENGDNMPPQLSSAELYNP